MINIITNFEEKNLVEQTKLDESDEPKFDEPKSDEQKKIYQIKKINEQIKLFQQKKIEQRKKLILICQKKNEEIKKLDKEIKQIMKTRRLKIKQLLEQKKQVDENIINEQINLVQQQILKKQNNLELIYQKKKEELKQIEKKRKQIIQTQQLKINELVIRIQQIEKDKLKEQLAEINILDKQINMINVEIDTDKYLYNNKHFNENILLEKYDNKLIILFIATYDYIKFLTYIIKSIAINVKIDYIIYIHLINISLQVRDETIEILKNINKNIIVFFEDTNYSTIKNPNNFNKSLLSSYSANIRIKLINMLLDVCKNNIMYLDVDSIIRSDLKIINQLLIKNDIILAISNPKKITSKGTLVRSGIIICKNNIQTKIFFKYVEKEINIMGITKWFSDQNALKKVYLKYINPWKTNTNNLYPKIACVPKTLLDWDFMSNSIIWTGKGERKDKNLIYLKELKKYQ